MTFESNTMPLKEERKTKANSHDLMMIRAVRAVLEAVSSSLQRNVVLGTFALAVVFTCSIEPIAKYDYTMRLNIIL